MTDIQEDKIPEVVHLSKDYPLLSSIGSPADVKRLDESQLPALCTEIRNYLIERLSVNPGHFASSMGAVDIIVALHYIFDAPFDRIVFDVGHQAYAHKLLTGRFHEFEHQRMMGGLSGFPFPGESDYDTFVCGHAGNSISAALGMAIGSRGEDNAKQPKTVALVGDASISNGLAFEGLNNATQHPNNLLIVLNDNEMSIDDNVGALHRYLSELSTSARYNKWRFRIYDYLRRHGIIKEKGKGLVLRFNNALKSLVAGQQNIFEGLNIRYFGPFNGNDVRKTVQVLRDIKDMEGPRILHLHTHKGKGYEAAENMPAKWHAPGRFDAATGFRDADLASSAQKAPLWQEVFGDKLVELAKRDPRVVGITAAMPSGTSVGKLSEMPDRMFDVGISEGHAVTFAGGLATTGKIPFVAIYSAFLQRAYDNIIHDVAIQGLPVRFCIDRAGIVGEDGVTHHGMFDIPYLRIIPGLQIAAPMDPQSLETLMEASLEITGPLAIRYPRGKAQSYGGAGSNLPVEVGKSRKLRSHPDARIAVLSIGPTGHDVIKAIENLEKEGIKVTHYDVLWVKPLDDQALKEAAEGHDALLTVEDGTVAGGFGSMVLEWCATHGYSKPVKRLGIPEKWVYQGTPGQLKAECGYDADGIEKEIRHLLSEI